MTSLDDLLAVQELDTRIDQLRHRRETLPARAELSAAGATLATAEHAEQECHARLRELRASQKEAEDHASLLEDKAAAVDKSLYDGSVTAMKELEALQAELAMLKDHQAQHEDRALELMEAAEPVEEELSGLTAQVATTRTEIDRISQEITVAEAEIDVEIDQLQGERDGLAADLPAEILSTYDSMRRRLGGVGAARLSGARCEGCYLEIPSAQLEEVRRAPADALVTCPECMRILVR